MAFILFVILPVVASAHELKDTSARITLRDGQVEVRIWVDMSRWKIRFRDNQAWLLGDISQPMPAALTAEQTKAFVIKVLNEDTVLTLNKQTVALTLLAISEPKSSVKHKEHTEFVFISKHQHSRVEQIDIRFPKSLGSIHASFVKPKYKMLAAGSTAQVFFPAPEK